MQFVEGLLYGYIPDDATVDQVGSYSCSFPTNPSMSPANNNVMGNSPCREVLSARQIAAFHYLVAIGVTTKYTQFSSTGYPTASQAYVFSGNQTISSLPSVFNSIIIQAGANVTISNCRLLAAQNAKIIVEPTAKLTLNCVEIRAKKKDEFWEGIEVWGDVNASQSVNSSGMPDYQGMLVADHCLIKDAKTAICVAKKNTAGIDYTKAGGIINSSNNQFVNNQIGVDLYPYNTFHRNPDWNGNRSFFKKDAFTFDPNYHDLVAVPPFAHIRGESVVNIKIYGCSFYDGNNGAFQSVTSSPYQTYGIYGIDSRFIVKDYCSNPASSSVCNSTLVRNTFENLFYSIYLNNANGNYSTVDHVVFNSSGYFVYTYVYCNNVQNMQVINNNFNVAGAGNLTSNACGLYLNNCSGYVVENNTFSNPNPNYSGKVAGIYVNNSGPNANSIYNNTFNTLNQPLWALNQNYDPNSGIGLVMNCNDFSNSLYNIGIQKSGKCLNCVNNTGVAITQGVYTQNNDQTSVRNKYATVNCTAGENKYYINTSNTFAITTHGSFNGSQWHPTPQPSCSNSTELVDIVGPNPPNSNIKSVYCPVNASTISSFGSRMASNSELSTHRANKAALTASITALLDGGNTTTLLNTIASSNNLNSLKNELITKAFLSDTVISAFVRKAISQEQLVKDVFDKNYPLSPQLYNKISSLNLPANARAYINSKQSENKQSQYSILKSQLDLASREINLIHNKAIRQWLDDENGPQYDSILSIYATGEVPNAKFDKVKLLIAAKRFSDAQQAITALRNESAAYTGFCDLQDVMLGITQNPASIQNLKTNNGLKNQLLNYSSKTDYLTEGVAIALLAKIYGIKVEEERTEPVQMLSNRLAGEQTTIGEIVLLEDHVRLYPNPAQDRLFVESDITSNAEIQIADISGKVILRQACGGNCNLSVSPLQSGIYFVNLYVHDQLISTRKLAVIK